MSSLSFIQRLNPVNNKMEWIIAEDDYDYNQEIATSCYGDMLHDEERNKKFGEALEKAIKKFHACGKEAHVLDIGTGTGLLSMLAVKHGADSVVACEAFLPMANCAINILKENNLSHRIKIIKAHSTVLTVGENGDLKRKANILVSEVFDTELIGEGAINTFNHAFEHLLEEDCIVIPSSGTVYAQVVESDLAKKWNKLDDWKEGEQVLIKIPNEIKICSGAGAVHDIQLSQFDKKHFKVLSEIIPIFRFDWAKNKKIPTDRQNKLVFRAVSSGRAQIIFMWWDLKMDEEGDIVISCAPVWENPQTKGNKMKNWNDSLPWRDHWMQAVYFLRNETSVRENECVTLVGNHDEFSFWFEIEEAPGQVSETVRPVCDCAFHFLLSRTRIGAMNDEVRRTNYLKALRTLVNPETICVVVSDISLLGFLCWKLCAKEVHILNENPFVEKVYGMLSVANGVTERMFVESDICRIAEHLSSELNNELLDVLIVSEPNFRNSILPWDNLAFWYLKEEFLNSVKSFKGLRSIKTLPKNCRLKCFAMQFDNLWKIATPLNTCEGFSMRIFDDIIASAKDKTENYTESQPLWEYPGIALTKVETVFEFDFNDRIPTARVKRDGNLEFSWSGCCDGVALWMEYCLTDDWTLSFGPLEDVVVGEYVTWDMFERQGVHLFRNRTKVDIRDFLYYEAEFDPQEAVFHFNFHIGCKEKQTLLKAPHKD